MASHRKRPVVHEEGHQNIERWLLTYADLITLLMVFFVVMYAISRADAGKFAQLQVALQKAFRVEVLKGNDPTSLHGKDGQSPLTALIEEAITQPPPLALDNRLVTNLEELRQELLRLPPPGRAWNQIEVGAVRDGIVISLAGNVLFDSGKADLRPDGLALLDLLAAHLRRLPNEVRVEGHTDDTPIATPLYPSNWELSAARATVVARYLVERGGVPPQRISAAAYGPYRPAASNAAREGRARNRRVDIVVLFAPVPVLAAGDGMAIMGGNP